MKKTLLLLIVAVFSVMGVHAQEGWVTHKTGRLSVKFPVAPKELQPGTMMASPDSSKVFILTVIDFTQFGLDSAALVPMKATPEFAGQIKTGMSGSLPGVTFADFKIGDLNGYTTYTTAGTDPQKKQYDMLMILIGNKMYSLSAVRRSGVAATDKDIYFASAIIAK